jgi:hypothetical protein
VEESKALSLGVQTLTAISMKYFNDQPSGLRMTHEGIAIVKVWEVFLLNNRHQIYSTLSTYSLDNGHEQKSGHDLSIVTFRFTTWDWNNTLKKLLAKHNIPVISETTHLKEDRVVKHA